MSIQDTGCLVAICRIASFATVRASTWSARLTPNTIEGFWSLFKRGIMGSLPQSQQRLSAAVRERICVALQQSEKPERICRFDYDVQ